MYQQDLPHYLQAWYVVSLIISFSPRESGGDPPPQPVPPGCPTKGMSAERLRLLPAGRAVSLEFSPSVSHQHRRAGTLPGTDRLRNGEDWREAACEAGVGRARCLCHGSETASPSLLSAGAFIPGVPVQPVVLRYPNQLVSVFSGSPVKAACLAVRTARPLSTLGF